MINNRIKQMMINDIKRCNEQKSAKGSQALYNELYTRYNEIFPKFKEGLCKPHIIRHEEDLDYSQYLERIAIKLQTYICMEEDTESIKRTGKIFISHSSKDLSLVQLLTSCLNAMGYDIQNDIFCSSIEECGVINGKSVSNEVVEEFLHSQIVVYCITNNFINSVYCSQELGANAFEKKECFIFKQEDVDNNVIKGFINTDIKYNLFNRDGMYSLCDKLINIGSLEKRIVVIGKAIDCFMEQIKDVLTKEPKENKAINSSKNKIKKDVKILCYKKMIYIQDLLRVINGVDGTSFDYPLEREEDYSLFAELKELVYNADNFIDYDEFQLIDIFKQSVNNILNKGYVILLAWDDNAIIMPGTNLRGKVAFVKIVTNEEYEKNKIKI